MPSTRNGDTKRSLLDLDLAFTATDYLPPKKFPPSRNGQKTPAHCVIGGTDEAQIADDIPATSSFLGNSVPRGIEGLTEIGHLFIISGGIHCVLRPASVGGRSPKGTT